MPLLSTLPEIHHSDGSGNNQHEASDNGRHDVHEWSLFISGDTWRIIATNWRLLAAACSQ